MFAGEQSSARVALVGAFTAAPMVALAVAVPVEWGWGLSWLDVGLAVVTIGFHRYLTHGAFRADRSLGSVSTDTTQPACSLHTSIRSWPGRSGRRSTSAR